MKTMFHKFDFNMFKVIAINTSLIVISALPYIEEGLRITSLAVTIMYTCYKFYSDKKKDK